MIRNPQIQFASADAIAAFQEERLREEVAYLYENSPYYRRMFDGCGMQPGDIRTTDDLRRLPVTTKTDLQLHPGEFVCVPRNRIIDYVTTSGTLGDPVTFALTEEDLARLAYNEAVSFTTAGCTGEDILQLMTTIDRRFMAGLAYFMGARELGCGVIRVGNGIPELQWDTIRRIGPTGCIVVPSFLIKLVGYAQEHGIDYRRIFDNSEASGQVKGKASYLTLDEVARDENDGRRAAVCATVVDVAEHTYKDRETGSRKRFARLTLSQNNRLAECVCWNDYYMEHRTEIQSLKDRVVILTAVIRYSDYNGCNTLQTYKNSLLFIQS